MEPLTHSLHGTCIQTINKTQLSSARTACVAETMNARFRSSMEDAFVLEDDFNSKGDGLYCVFDGHGGNSNISLFFSQSLHSDNTDNTNDNRTRDRGFRGGELCKDTVDRIKF